MFKAGSKYSMISINFEFMTISVHFIYFFYTFNLIFESQINASQFGLQTTRLRGINIQSLALQRDNWKCFLSYPSDFLIELHFSFAVIELYATKLKNWCHRTTSADSCDNETGNYRMLKITETCSMRVEQHTHKMGPEGGGGCREDIGSHKLWPCLTQKCLIFQPCNNFKTKNNASFLPLFKIVIWWHQIIASECFSVICCTDVGK